MNRRDFMLGTVALPAIAAAAEKAPLPEKKAATDDWAAVREQFVLSREHVHTALFYLATHSKPVREAIERHRAGLDLDPMTYNHEAGRKLEVDVRQAAAEYLEVSPDELAMTDSTTMGLGLVYGSLKLEPGAEVIATAHDHYSTHIALEHRIARDGIAVKTVSMYEAPESATAAKMTDAIVKAVGPKTRLVCITWVHSCSGVKTPVKAIADALAKLNEKRDAGSRVLLAVDGVHGLAAEDTSLPKLGCDIFIAGTHKWLFGPRGTGFVWAKADVWPLFQPMIPTFSGLAFPMWIGVVPKEPLKPNLVMTPGGFHSFEHRWAVADAFRWHASVGKAKVARRIHALNRQFKEGLQKMKHVKPHTPMSDELSCGINTFDVVGMKPDDVVKKLEEKKVLASVTPYREPRYARVSFGILNTPDDVKATLDAIAALKTA